MPSVAATSCILVHYRDVCGAAGKAGRLVVGVLIALTGTTLVGVDTVHAATQPVAAASPERITAEELPKRMGTRGQFELDDVVVTGDVALSMLEFTTSNMVFEGAVLSTASGSNCNRRRTEPSGSLSNLLRRLAFACDEGGVVSSGICSALDSPVTSA